MHEVEQGGDEARSVSNGLTALSIAYYPGNDSIERAQAGEAEFKAKRSSAGVDFLLAQEWGRGRDGGWSREEREGGHAFWGSFSC